ncbi:MAG: thioesterase [Halobacteriovoraceae bacterium]|nr:thioesterase [Peredibacter sp.]MBJ00791.1 thioesterase [Halobacteriovoraceae bacterium]
MEFNKFIYTLMIKENHLDTFGHVNNAAYLTLYEEARWDFITKNGYGLDVIQREQKGPVVLDVNLRFKRELKNRQLISIHSQSQDMSSKIMKMKQVMINPEGEVASEALFTFGFMDMKLRKLVEMPQDWLNAVT